MEKKKKKKITCNYSIMISLWSDVHTGLKPRTIWNILKSMLYSLDTDLLDKDITWKKNLSWKIISQNNTSNISLFICRFRFSDKLPERIQGLQCTRYPFANYESYKIKYLISMAWWPPLPSACLKQISGWTWHWKIYLCWSDWIHYLTWTEEQMHKSPRFMTYCFVSV